MNVLFVETSVFTRRVVHLGLEDVARLLQLLLIEVPDLGVVERGMHGVRKARIGSPAQSRGKRGGARVHYLHVPHKRIIYLLFVHLKSEQGDLTVTQRRALGEFARRVSSGDDK